MPEYNPLESVVDDPWGMIARDRTKCPIQYVEHEGVGLYQALGYRALEEILRDPVRFSNRFSATPSPEMQLAGGYGDSAVPVLSFADPPEHSRQRRLLVGAFSPGRVNALEPHISDVANALVDAMPVGGGRFELIEGWARHLVVTVIAELLGVPLEDRERFARWTQIAEEFAGSLDVNADMEAVLEFASYIDEQISSRREAKNPPDDLLTALIKVEREGEKLLPGEIQPMVQLLLAAGNATTTNNIGNLVYLLETNPDQKAALLEDLEDRAFAAVEEGLRMDPPIHGLFRTATVDAEIDGVSIPRGGQVYNCYAAGNHDPEFYEDPDTFDISRDWTSLPPHLGFGMGVHHCIGSNLARMETLVAIRTLYRRLPNLRMVDGFEPNQINGMIFRSWSSMEMEYDGPIRP